MEAPRPRSHDVREGARGPVRTAVDQPARELQGPALGFLASAPGPPPHAVEARAHDTKSRARESARGGRGQPRARTSGPKDNSTTRVGAAPPRTARGWRSPTATPGA